MKSLILVIVSCISMALAQYPYLYPHGGGWPYASWSSPDFYPGIYSPSPVSAPPTSRSDAVSSGGLKSLHINNDLADKLFPFTIRIASHGEPHMPVVKVGHQPFTLGAGLWGKPQIHYGRHIHHHPHHYIPPPPPPIHHPHHPYHHPHQAHHPHYY